MYNYLKDRLASICKEWELWAEVANRREDGWESDFPQWRKLIDCASQLMCKENIDDECLSNIEFCWTISEEDEELLDFSLRNIDKVFPVLVRLTSADSSICRWQVYVALSAAGPKAEKYLQHGVRDNDNYVRRRALIAIAPLKPSNLDTLILECLNDLDPYIRQISLELVKSSRDEALVSQVLIRLINDEVCHVRKAAEDYLRSQEV